ncbi:MAG TPA: PrsW family glutamic-type intramembrane protease [Bryobacteraceae bacterium]|jgi:RsiW-degrading membrane proteinase PrsW (M82 family)|nr:PrsW family glutamic-type intramembrane protease [Bryobacteraceae bacterium]
MAASTWIDDALRLVLALLPVLMFLAALRVLDSYKLVSLRTVGTALAAGAAAAALCYGINTIVFRHLQENEIDHYIHFGAPVVEELAKGAFWIFLIATARVAFMVDSAICGFAIGAGFALVENVSYLGALNGRDFGVWLLRGFGTAVMHGGVAAIGAFISVYLFESRQWRGVRQFAPGLLTAMMLHSLFNQGVLSPAGSTAATVVGLPVIFMVVFYFSERSLHRWLGGKLDQDIDMIAMIASGEYKQTPQGAYLMSLNEAFPPEVRGDMLTFLHLTLELSARAKGDLIRREAGLTVPPDPAVESHFKELKYLETSIGPTGMLAIRPLLSRSPRDLWEMHQLSH